MLALLAWLYAPGANVDALEAPAEPDAIVGGRDVEEGELEAAVGLLIGNGTLCSGVLIHPELVMTAAHCFDRAEDDSRVLVIWGNDIAAALAAGNVLESARWEVHPDWCYQLGCQSTDDDIAFVQLEAPAPALPIPPVVLETRWSASTRIGQTLELVGFGGDELGPGGESGIKRTAAAPVQQVYRTEKLLIGEDGASSTFGDSGGPALLRLSDGSYEVVGLASYAIGAANSEGWYISVFPSLCWVREASGVELPSMPDDWTCEEPIDNAAESCSVSNTRNAPPSLLLLTPCLLRRRRQQSR